ncbi:hypothetical protein B0F90DRAFT_307244 [Multifurca ochricompacta]|uniref:Uncharacterized protein n=1 Tax=Multifurca ochricompacta TaxID=376703 RepID=A0AAD4QL60_9AGAM|nr:hypothetical protein B0F90DRAFT_307244 [Multifurca ochricompacta]
MVVNREVAYRGLASYRRWVFFELSSYSKVLLTFVQLQLYKSTSLLSLSPLIMAVADEAIKGMKVKDRMLTLPPAIMLHMGFTSSCIPHSSVLHLLYHFSSLPRKESDCLRSKARSAYFRYRELAHMLPTTLSRPLFLQSYVSAQVEMDARPLGRS